LSYGGLHLDYTGRVGGVNAATPCRGQSSHPHRVARHGCSNASPLRARPASELAGAAGSPSCPPAPPRMAMPVCCLARRLHLRPRLLPPAEPLGESRGTRVPARAHPG